jgi:hypothetical protein
MKVKVVRGFVIGGKTYLPDDKKPVVVNVDDNVAKGLVASGKAEFVDKSAAPAGPMTTESVKG